jgi:hypothetical protein
MSDLLYFLGGLGCGIFLTVVFMDRTHKKEIEECKRNYQKQ